MATSGSIDYSTSAQLIITEALELLGVLGEGQTPTADQYASSLRTLNMMVKTWQADGLNLFAVQACYLFLNSSQQVYNLSASSSDAFTATFGQTTTSAQALAGDGSIDVTSVSGLLVSDKMGIATSGTTMFWTTVASIAGTTVTLNDVLPADVALDATIYFYTTTANRPMRILEAYVHRFNQTDIPIGIISRVDYWSLSSKNSQGQTVQCYYDPQINQGNLYVWPVDSSELDYLILQCQRTLDDFDDLSNSPDYPQEWYMILTYGLAVMLAPKYGTPAMDYQRLQNTFISLYEMARDWDVEQETSVYLKPDTRDSIGRIGG